MSELDGILPVLKPAGWTSHDVVAKVRGMLRMKRIGHTGTLDPAVTGVLPLCLGRATRLVEYLQELPKEYEAVLRLGIATDTEDMTGNVIAQMSDVHITEAQVREAVQQFIGEIDQIPPMFSAVQVDGKRLYELAREGKTVERKPRQVTIHEIEIIHMSLATAEPQIHFRAVCSKGTYIRTLCVDIGKALGVPATMASLTRTMSANMTKEHCLTLEQIAAYAQAGTIGNYLLSMDKSISHLPAHTIAQEKAYQAVQGQKISGRSVTPEVDQAGAIRLYSPEGQFYGIFERRPEETCIRPVKVFLPQ